MGARQAPEAKKGGDKGIDGKLLFHDDAGSITKTVVLSVKAGHVVPAFVRDLRGVVEREAAAIGVLISFEEPTAGMRAEAAAAGEYESPWGFRHPKLQLLTVDDLLNGKRIDYPNTAGSNVTLRRAARLTPATGLQTSLFAPPNPASDDEGERAEDQQE